MDEELDEVEIDRLALAADSDNLIDIATEDEIKAYEAVKQQQKDQLNDLRQNEDTKNVTNSNDLGNRLNYLMKQSEVFSHFLSGANMKLLDNNASSSSSSSSSSSTFSSSTSSHKVSTKTDKTNRGRPKMSERDEDVNLVKSLQDNTRITWLENQPSILVGGTLRAYQMEGLNWLIRLHDNSVNGILADEMGLGKTIQTIALLAYLKQFRHISGPHLIITPKSTITNWIKEFQKWCPSFRLIKLLGSKEERQTIVKEQMLPGSFDVVISSNESVVKEGSKLMKFKWRYVIIDEAHRIKNEKAVLSKFVRLLHTDFKLLMTGTPLQNNLQELWSLLNFILPDVFGDSHQFDSWFNTIDSIGTENVMKRLHMILKPFMLRRVKNDVEKELLPKKEIKLFIGLSQLQRDWYTRILCKDIEQLNTSIYATDRFKLLNILMQLRKCCNHPYLFDGAEIGPPYEDGPHIWENSGKMSVLHKLLPKLKKQGSRVLIFSQMTRMLDILEDYLILQGYLYCRIDGSTDTQDRDLAIENFNLPNSDKFIFLLSTRAGGLGINLQTADTVILYDSDFNPQVDLQAMDRAHRIGQTKQVRIFRFIIEKSVEEKMIERADRKLFLDAAVIQQGRFTEKTNQITKGEMINMVRFGADEIMSAKDGTGILTDEDIDILLKKGEDRTVTDMEKIKTEMQHNLANFSLGFIAENQMINLFTFEGEDYRGKVTKSSSSSSSSSVNNNNNNNTNTTTNDGEIGIDNNNSSSSSSSSTMFINLPQRERKRPFDVEMYFKMALKGQIFNPSDTLNHGKFEKMKKKKIWTAPDYQFFDRTYFEQLQKKEEMILEEKQKILAIIKDLKKRERKGLMKLRHREKRKYQKKIRKSNIIQSSSSTCTTVNSNSNSSSNGSSSGSSINGSVDTKEEKNKSHDDDNDDVSEGIVEDEEDDSDNSSNNNNNNNDDDDDEEEVEDDDTADDTNTTASLKFKFKFKDPCEYGRQAQLLQDKIDAGDYDLPLLLKQEKELKKREAFIDWAKNDYKLLIDCIEKIGYQSMEQKDKVINDLIIKTKKEKENILRYYDTFFTRMSELNDYLKIKERFAKADMVRLKHLLIQQLLQQKVTKYKNAWQYIDIDYSSDIPDLYFSQDNDKIILEALYKHGYGNWDKIRQDTRNAPQFQFDWFIRSRSCADVEWRCDYLMKLLGNEIYRSGALLPSAINSSSSSGGSGAGGHKKIGSRKSMSSSSNSSSSSSSSSLTDPKSKPKHGGSKASVPDSDDDDDDDDGDKRGNVNNNNNSDESDDENDNDDDDDDDDDIPAATTTSTMTSLSGRKRNAVVLYIPGTNIDIKTTVTANNSNNIITSSKSNNSLKIPSKKRIKK